MKLLDLKQNNEDQRRDDFWKRLLILQNHDVSVARGYRAISEDDIVTDANSLFLRDLKKLLQDLKKECILPKDKINLFSYNGASGIKDFEFDIEENDVHVYHNGVRLPSSIQMGKLHVAIPIQSYQTTQKK